MTLKEECKENWPWLVLAVVVMIAAVCLVRNFYWPLLQDADRMEQEQRSPYRYQPQIQKLPSNHDSIGFKHLPEK